MIITTDHHPFHQAVLVEVFVVRTQADAFVGVLEFGEEFDVCGKFGTHLDALRIFFFTYGIEFFQVPSDQFLAESHPRSGTGHSDRLFFFVLLPKPSN